MVGFQVKGCQEHHIRAVPAFGGVIRAEQHDGFHIRRNLERLRITSLIRFVDCLRAFVPEVAEEAALSIPGPVKADRRAEGNPGDENEQE